MYCRADLLTRLHGFLLPTADVIRYTDRHGIALRMKINDYLVKHSPLVTHHVQVVAFDWDGTLYSEQIALHDLPQPYTQLNGMRFAGQPAWMIFSAIHHNGFPAFKTERVLHNLNSKEIRGKIRLKSGA